MNNTKICIAFLALVSCRWDRCPYLKETYTDVHFNIVVDSLWHDVNRDFVFQGFTQPDNKPRKYGNLFLSQLFLATDKGDQIMKKSGESMVYLCKKESRDTLKFDYECRNGDIYLNGKKQ